jgi:hypothetical protein
MSLLTPAKNIARSTPSRSVRSASAGIDGTIRPLSTDDTKARLNGYPTAD